MKATRRRHDATFKASPPEAPPPDEHTLKLAYLLPFYYSFLTPLRHSLTFTVSGQRMGSTSQLNVEHKNHIMKHVLITAGVLVVFLGGFFVILSIFFRPAWMTKSYGCFSSRGRIIYIIAVVIIMIGCYLHVIAVYLLGLITIFAALGSALWNGRKTANDNSNTPAQQPAPPNLGPGRPR